MRIGDAPRHTLEARGLLVVMTCNRIEDAIWESFDLMATRKASRASS